MTPSPRPEKPSVLIVDDIATNIKVLANLLRNDWTVFMAIDGPSALEAVAERPPDIILLDIEMPVMSGYEVCRRLKANPATADIPIIFVTARDGVKDEEKGFALGAVDYIHKPFHPTIVRARVNSQWQRRRAEKNLLLAYQMLRLHQETMENDLRTAAAIQEKMLPGTEAPSPYYELAWAFHPSTQVGGDIISLVELGLKRTLFYILDISGHGVSAAMVSISVGQFIRQLLANNPELSPAEIVKALDKEYPIERFDKFFTLIVLIYDAEKQELGYCNAGHPAAILLREDGSESKLKKGGLPVGLGELSDYEEATIAVAPRDLVFLYTDGLSELENEDGEQLGAAALSRTLRENQSASANELIRLIEKQVAEHIDAAPTDDISCACLKLNLNSS